MHFFLYSPLKTNSRNIKTELQLTLARVMRVIHKCRLPTLENIFQTSEMVSETFTTVKSLYAVHRGDFENVSTL